VPVFLTCAVLVNWGAWRRVLRRSWALIGLAIGIAVTFGPLAYQHVAHPEKIGRRGRSTSVWSPDDPVPERLRKVLARYGEHFGPEFLYSSSDVYDVAWTSGVGFLPGFLIPCVAAGVVVCVPRLRRSRAARLLVLAVVLYPVGDCLNWHPSPNGLRSAVGLWGLMLAGAVAIRHVPPILVARRLRTTALALGVGLCAALVVQEAGFMHKYFTQRRSQWRVYAGNHIDLLAACDWLRPRLNDVDAVICTSLDFNQPYVIPLVALSHDPRRWFAEPQDWRPEGEWDCWTRYGKFYFVQPKERPAILAQLKGGGAGRRVVFILREQEMPPGEPADRITGPDGKTALAIYEVVL
jgi:hypothetical protein